MKVTKRNMFHGLAGVTMMIGKQVFVVVKNIWRNGSDGNNFLTLLDEAV
jgi:hypothetical protein